MAMLAAGGCGGECPIDAAREDAAAVWGAAMGATQ